MKKLKTKENNSKLRVLANLFGVLAENASKTRLVKEVKLDSY